MSNSQPHHPQELNYHARKKGRHTKTHKFHSSPLHDQHLNTLLITSRCRTKSNHSQQQSLSDSIIWLNEVKMDQPDKILVVEEEQQSRQILIIDSDQQEQPANTNLWSARRQQENPSTGQQSSRVKTSILICEQSEDLLWINKQQYFQQNSPQHQYHNYGRESYSYGQNNHISQADEYERKAANTHRKQLSNIEELSSRAQEDQEENFDHQHLMKAPISPQTQPLLKLKPIQDFTSRADKKRRAFQEDIDSPVDQLQQSKQQKLQRRQFFTANINLEQLFPTKRPKIDKKLIRELLDGQRCRIFEEQLLELSQIAKRSTGDNKKNVEDIIAIIREEQTKLQQRLEKQQSLLRQLRCSVSARRQIVRPTQLDVQQSVHFKKQDQIALNCQLLRRMVALSCRK